MDSYSNFHQQQTESPQQNDEWSCSTEDWNFIEQCTTKKNFNSWFDKSENQHEQNISSLQHNVNNQDFENKKCDNSIETDDNFWVDVENREILPPESFQNESLQATMSNLQITNEMIHSNTCDNKITFNNSENLKRNLIENDDDKPPVGLHRLVTGQTKSFDDYSNPEPCGPQPFDVRTVPGQLSDDDIPVQRHVTGSRSGTRPIDNNSNFQSIDSNSVPLKRPPSLEQFQNQFEGHSRHVLHRDVEDFINHPNDNKKSDDSARGLSDNDNYTSIRNESQPELKEPVTVIKKNRPKMSDHELFERTGPDGYMNETSPYLRSTTQNQMVKSMVDSQPDNSLKLSTSTQDSNERFQEYDRLEKRAEKKHPLPPLGFHRMVEGNIGEEGVQKPRQPQITKKNDERQRRHSIDSDSSVQLNNSLSEDCRKTIRRDPQLKKYNKSSEHYHNRDRRNRHPRESEEDYFYEEENASLSPDVELEYRSHRSRNHLSKRFRQRIPHENYDHSDIEFQSEYDEFDEYDRRRRYRSPESERYRRPPKHYRDRRYQDEMSGQYYRKDDVGYRMRPSSRTDSDYLQDYTSYIEMLDPLERRNYLLKFRENNPKAYTLWYTNYKTKVEMQKLISRTKNGSECSTPVSTQSHDVGSLNHMAGHEKEKEIHRNTPPRYQKYHINAKMNMAFGLLFMLDSSNAKLGTFKVIPELNDNDTAELFKFSAPFVLGKTHKNAVIDYLNTLAEEALNNSERLLYELISMITKRNGIVHGTDISEILMDNVAQVPVDDVFCANMNLKDNKDLSVEPFHNFRNLLLQGDKTKTLELAISNQDWGLAYSLASYMDSKTFNYVRFKYFQTIPQNDTLQTFFQLTSGKIPSCTTCCTDSNWGDWRKHLAMILSNQHENINIARSAIIQLGDTLNAKGDVFGAHFCYLSIQVPLESIGLSSKLTLLGTSSNKHFDILATNRAILLTSAYEFSMRLNISDFYIPSLLPYKYLLAIRLAEYGECEQALHHLEAIATQVISFPGSVNLGFVANVIELSTDLHYMQISNCNLPGSLDVLDWLETLKNIFTHSENNYKPVDDNIPPQQIDNYQSNEIKSAVIPSDLPTIPDSSIDYSISYQTPQTQVPLQVVQPSPLQVVQPPPSQVVQQPPPSTVNPYWQPNVVSLPTESAPPPQNDYTQYYDPTSMTMPGELINQSSPNEMTSEISTIAPELTLMAESENPISTAPKFGFFDRQMAELEPQGTGVSENKSAVKKDTDKRSQKEKNSWLGGLTKFWKPSNHTESVGEDFGNNMVQQAAPPMDSELSFNPVANSSPANQTQNQFKIQRKRGAKDKYVNVLSNSKPTESILAPDSIIQTSQQSSIYNPPQ